VPLRRDRAFVLGAIPLREKDRIVTFLGEESGKKRAVARGARRLQSATSGSLEPMSEIEVLYFEKEGRDLARIDSVSRIRSSFPLAATLEGALLLSAMAESLSTFVSDSEPAEKFFRLASHAVAALFEGAEAPLVSAYFDLWVLRLSGVLPELSQCASCGERMAGGPAALSETLPGFVCRNCSVRGGVRLSRSFGAAAAAVLGRRIPDLALSARELAEISGAAARLRRHFLGHELKSQRVLDDVLNFPR
jgi:DNA repair protein RecO (recombination protein O)